MPRKKGSKVERKGSSSQLNNRGRSDWTNLPTELLMMIFNELRVGDMYLELQPILRSRQVHPRWKLVMDELLEKWCLEHWTKWEPDEDIRTPHHYDFPRLTLNNEFEEVPDGFRVEDILCPRSLLEGDSPPSTKHVCIGETLGREVQVPNDFSKYGHHLTSLSFTYIHLPNPLSLTTLARILHFTPNLKAVALQRLEIKKEERAAVEKIILPSLPHLEHLRVSGVTDGGSRNLTKFRNIGWLLKPYKKQLVSLQTDNAFEWDNNHDGELVLENLKRLKLCPPSTEILKAEVELPSLQCLSLGRLQAGEKGPITLQLIQKFVSNYCSTLIELHLDIRPEGLYHCRYRPRTYAKGKGDEGRGPPITNLTFPLLKTLWIFYPQCDKEVRVVNDFLNMAPACETLKLMPDHGENNGEKAKEHLMKQQYWRACAKLKTIRVQVVDNDVIFTMRAPFP